MVYRYVAYTTNKKLVRGTVSGVSEAAATKVLMTQGYQPITLKPQTALPPVEEMFPSLFKVTTKEVIMFSRQLATLLDAGISIVPALQLIRDQTNNRLMKKVIAETLSDLQSGSSLSEALSRHEKIFGELYCQLMVAGERIGALGTMLKRAADYLEKDEAIKKKIKKALMYPVIVLAVAAVVVTVLTLFVLPKMTDMFDALGSELPLTTRMLIGSVDFITAYNLHLLAGIGGMISLLALYVRRPAGRYQLDRLLLKVPLIGKANLMSEMARFSRTLVLLVQAGLPLPEVIAMARQTSSNVVIKESLAEVRTGLLQGEGLSEPMSRDKTFPNLLVQMVMVGEESGKLESTLETVAKSYETEADEKISGMISMIEPAMTLVLAAMIGFIALSVITPMYTMSDALK